jgi:hypothetical protein
MSRVRPLSIGDQRHLPEGSIRWSVARQMRLAADMAAQAGDPAAVQYAVVLAGGPVLLTREQVRSFVPPARRPDNLDRWPLWVLEGNDRLKVYRRKAKA